MDHRGIPWRRTKLGDSLAIGRYPLGLAFPGFWILRRKKKSAGGRIANSLLPRISAMNLALSKKFFLARAAKGWTYEFENVCGGRRRSSFLSYGGNAWAVCNPPSTGALERGAQDRLRRKNKKK